MGRRSSAPAVLGFDVSGTDGSALLLHKFSTWRKRRSRAGARLLLLHLEGLGIDHRVARSRGIPVVPRGDAG
jgi:hypothetical protein